MFIVAANITKQQKKPHPLIRYLLSVKCLDHPFPEIDWKRMFTLWMKTKLIALNSLPHCMPVDWWKKAVHCVEYVWKIKVPRYPK